MKKTSFFAFTLVELLVVIAIIGVLILNFCKHVFGLIKCGVGSVLKCSQKGWRLLS
jgi:prepilin-type N-terminal cleavage/methylation domain-containing protein